MTGLTQDVRYALRQLRKSPGFTFIALLILALGIGANSAVFSAVDAILLKSLPYPHGEELMLMRQYMPKANPPSAFVAPMRLEDWNRMNSTFQALTGYYTEDVSETSGELPQKVTEALVAPRFLQVFGIAPILGRDFSPEEETFGGPSVVLISNRLWRQRFRSDPNVVGKKLRFGNDSNSVVGVMPASFLYPTKDVDLWAPVPSNAPYAQSRESTWYTVNGRLKPRVTVDQARADFATVQSRLGTQFPDTDSGIAVQIVPLKEDTVAGSRRSLWILYSSVTLLLLIACTNIAALLLARMTGRGREISIRFSLGASRASVLRQLLTEVFILALTGSMAGLGIARGGAKLIRRFGPNLPRAQEITRDWRIVYYCLGSALVITAICGILPALRGSRIEIAGALATTNRRQICGRTPIQWVLVGVQVALAVALLVGAGLFERSLRELSRVSPGFDPSHVLTLHVSASWGETADMKSLTQRIHRTLDGLRALPGVQAAATSGALPGVPSHRSDLELRVPDSEQNPSRKIVADARFVSSGYFEVIEIPVLAGESCPESPNSPSVVVNRSFANTYFGTRAAIGHQVITTAFAPSFLLQGQIRGIAGDAREQGINREPVPTVYCCISAPVPDPYYMIRTRGEPVAMADTLRRTLAQLEPSRSVFGIQPLTEHLSESFAEDRMRTVLLSLFALTAVSLACLGIYGTLSYFVSMRRREVGVQLALGALPQRIVLRYLFQGMRVVIIGCLFGLVIAAVGTRVLSGMLYGVSSFDLATFAGVVVLVLSVATLSTLIPAAQAASTDPIEVLREE